MEQILDQINQPNDIKQIDPAQYKRLAREIRAFLIQKVSKNGGHLSSNLGAVELTMALHLFLDLPTDKLIWDVGHQAYTHKILTGRREEFEHLREYGGLSGFPKRKESECDSFDTGHSSTSLSLASGLVSARELSGEHYKVVAVIGDGALGGGMAFEALNNLGKLKSNMMIVLNDNRMSISENVGGMANYLAKIRTNSAYTGLKDGLEEALNKVPGVGGRIVQRLKQSKDSLKHLFISGMLFEEMGITYIGPIDGHNINQVLRALETASRAKKAVLIHVVTKKGKGYEPAETDPGKYHGVGPFSVKTGKIKEGEGRQTYTDIFSKTMVKLGMENPKITAITAAMPSGTGLDSFAEQYPERFFDVGIAEEHAVTFAAGMAAGGYHPVVAVYSTFLQRAYDQIVHDVCIGGLPVTFAIDRAGVVGKDGETHQGIFDISFLAHIPGLTLLAPGNGDELEQMLRFAVKCDYPTAIRYPKGSAAVAGKYPVSSIVQGKSDCLFEGQDITILAVGSMVESALQIREQLEEKNISTGILNMRFIHPMDEEAIIKAAKESSLLVTMEENIRDGGFGERVAAFLSQMELTTPIKIVALDNSFIEQGDPMQLKRNYGLCEETLIAEITEFFSKKGRKRRTKHKA